MSGLWSKWLKLSALSLSVMALCSGSVLANEGDASSVSTAQGASALKQGELPLVDVELNVGFTLVPPFAFVTESISEVQGIDPDVVRELQRRTGFKLKNDKFNLMNFSEIMDLGQEGKVDIIGGGITLSDSRREFFDFSEPCVDSALVLAVTKNSDIKDESDLKNRTLSVEAGTTAVDFFPDAEEMNIKIVENPTAFMSIFALHANQADALVMDEPMIAFYVDNWRNSNLKIVKRISEPSPLGLLFKKDATFTPYLQQAYRDMVADGTLERIKAKYGSQSRDMAAN